MKAAFTFLLAAVMGTAVGQEPVCQVSGKTCAEVARETKVEAPFDVPPKEWDGPDEHNVRRFDVLMEKVHHRVCEDKTRFLLASEDGKWHCLALGAKP